MRRYPRRGPLERLDPARHGAPKAPTHHPCTHRWDPGSTSAPLPLPCPVFRRRSWSWLLDTYKPPLSQRQPHFSSFKSSRLHNFKTALQTALQTAFMLGDLPLSALRRRGYVYVAITTFVLGVLYYSLYYPRVQPSPYLDRLPSHYSGVADNSENATLASPGAWNFTKDGRNLLMTDAQCSQAFPDLYYEIDRAVASRRNNPITLKEIDKVPVLPGYTRVMIYDQQLYVLATGSDINLRDQATLHALHRALITSPEPLPNIEMTLQVNDIAEPHAQWSFARKSDQKKLWLMPDFGYWSWPEPKVGSYHEVQLKTGMRDVQFPWSRKKNKLVWRGAMMDLQVRKDLVENSKDKSWSDVRNLVWKDEAEGHSHNLLTIDEHCKYKYIAHTEGVSYSSRLQNIQNCESVVVSHKLQWIQHHHHLMKSSGEGQNFVETKEDFSNLDEKMKELVSDEEMAKAIAENSVKTFRERYLSQAAETCYWRKLIRGWGSVQGFEPEFFRKGYSGEWRGLPIESFLLERRLDWHVY